MKYGAAENNGLRYAYCEGVRTAGLYKGGGCGAHALYKQGRKVFCKNHLDPTKPATLLTKEQRTTKEDSK